MNVIVSKSLFCLILVSGLQLTSRTSLCAVSKAAAGAPFSTDLHADLKLVVWSGSVGNRYIEEVTGSTDVDKTPGDILAALMENRLS